MLPMWNENVLETPLIYAVRTCSPVEVLEVILSNTLDPNQADDNGLTALDHLVIAERRRHNGLDLFYNNLLVPDFHKTMARVPVRDHTFLGCNVTASERTFCRKALLLLKRGADPCNLNLPDKGLDGVEGMEQATRLLRHFQDARTWELTQRLGLLRTSQGRLGEDMLEKISTFLVPHQWLHPIRSSKPCNPQNVWSALMGS